MTNKNDQCQKLRGLNSVKTSQNDLRKDLRVKIENFEQYVDFVKQVSSKYNMLVVQLHTYIFEFGTDVVPYFRLLWSPDKLAPMLSFHVDTRNSDAVQFYCQLHSMADNVMLLESYYVSQAGEISLGDEAYVAAQVDYEANYIESTTEALVPETQEEPAAFISATPIYTPGDPRGEEQKKLIKKRKQGLTNL